MRVHLKRINDEVALEAINESGQTMLIDGSEQVGGQGMGMRPMEIMLGALVACSTIDVLVIMKKKRISLQHYEVEVSGHRKDAVPSPFEQIHLLVHIGAQDPAQEVEKAMQMSLDKYCSVHASMNPGIQVTFEIKQA